MWSVFCYVRKRALWLMLLLAALLPLAVALVLQHHWDLPPCVLCIYQRVALLGIALSALPPLCAPSYRFLRGGSIILWIYSAIRGLLVAWEQLQRYWHPSHFRSCAFRVRFPTGFPLDDWFPSVFRAEAPCEGVVWSWLGISAPLWMVLLFAAHIMVGLLLLFRAWAWLEKEP